MPRGTTGRTLYQSFEPLYDNGRATYSLVLLPGAFELLLLDTEASNVTRNQLARHVKARRCSSVCVR
jgi:hypothetical protein